jgi:hypothetical protein
MANPQKRLSNLPILIQERIISRFESEDPNLKGYTFFLDQILPSDSVAQVQTVTNAREFWRIWLAQSNGTVDELKTLCKKNSRFDILDTLNYPSADNDNNYNV